MSARQFIGYLERCAAVGAWYIEQPSRKPPSKAAGTSVTTDRGNWAHREPGLSPPALGRSVPVFQDFDDFGGGGPEVSPPGL